MSTKSLLMKTTARLLLQYGYHATTVNKITEACFLSPSAIYFYFTEGKQQLIRASIEQVIKTYRNDVFPIGYHTTSTFKKRIIKFCNALKDLIYKDYSASLITIISTQIVHGEDKYLIKLVKDFFEEWKNVFFDILAPLLEKEKALRIARESVSTINWAIIMDHLHEDTQHTLIAIECLKKLLLRCCSTLATCHDC